MDVYLVPVGHGRHELYCEVADATEVSGPEQPPDPTTLAGRFNARFIAPLVKRAQAAIADAEREWREHQAGRREVPATRWGRAKARMRAWVAEKVAEQRLLWHLRKQDRCRLFHSENTTPDDALSMMRAILQRDYERHRKWFAVHTTLFVASGIFFFIPGPNLIAYVFFFRLAGHYLSMKGARHGLDVTAWTMQPCKELCELEAVAAMPAPERGERVRAIADALGLEHLATFFNRVAAV
jgi:hypothetical protein